MDSIGTEELDEIYRRTEKSINTDSEGDIERFVGTHKTFDGRYENGNVRYKLRVIGVRGDQKELVKTLYRPSELKNDIQRADSIEKLSLINLDREKIPRVTVTPLKKVLGLRLNYLERTESVREIISTKELFNTLGARWRGVKSLSEYVRLSEEETVSRLSEIGVNVENGRIIR